MAVPVRAGIDFAGRRFRYAVVQAGRGGNRLLRVGEVDFDFDLVGVLSRRGLQAEREVLVEALREAVGTSGVADVRFGLRPPLAQVFLTRPTPGYGEPAAVHEARILGLPVEEVSHVRIEHPDPYEGGPAFVSVVPGSVYATLATISSEAGVPAFAALPAVRAAGEIVRSIVRSDGPVLGIGVHGTVVEIAAFERRRWRAAATGHVAGPRDVEALAEAVVACAGLDAGSVRRMRYGSGETLADADLPGYPDLEAVGAFGVVQHDEAGMDPAIEPALFGTAIGAAIL